MKIIHVLDCFWNGCLYQNFILKLLILLRSLLLYLFLATSVHLFSERSSTTTLPTAVIISALYVKQHNPVIFLKIAPTAWPQLFQLIWLIEGSSILRRGLCYDWFCLYMLLHVYLFLFLAFPFYLTADTRTIHVDYYSYWLIRVHRPFICAQTISIQYKYL